MAAAPPAPKRARANFGLKWWQLSKYSDIPSDRSMDWLTTKDYNLTTLGQFNSPLRRPAYSELHITADDSEGGRRTVMTLLRSMTIRSVSEALLADRIFQEIKGEKNKTTTLVFSPVAVSATSIFDLPSAAALAEPTLAFEAWSSSRVTAGEPMLYGLPPPSLLSAFPPASAFINVPPPPPPSQVFTSKASLKRSYDDIQPKDVATMTFGAIESTLGNVEKRARKAHDVVVETKTAVVAALAASATTASSSPTPLQAARKQKLSSLPAPSAPIGFQSTPVVKLRMAKPHAAAAAAPAAPTTSDKKSDAAPGTIPVVPKKRLIKKRGVLVPAVVAKLPNIGPPKLSATLLDDKPQKDMYYIAKRYYNAVIRDKVKVVDDPEGKVFALSKQICTQVVRMVDENGITQLYAHPKLYEDYFSLMELPALERKASDGSMTTTKRGGGGGAAPVFNQFKVQWIPPDLSGIINSGISGILLKPSFRLAVNSKLYWLDDIGFPGLARNASIQPMLQPRRKIRQDTVEYAPVSFDYPLLFDNLGDYLAPFEFVKVGSSNPEDPTNIYRNLVIWGYTITNINKSPKSVLVCHLHPSFIRYIARVLLQPGNRAGDSETYDYLSRVVSGEVKSLLPQIPRVLTDDELLTMTTQQRSEFAQAVTDRELITTQINKMVVDNFTRQITGVKFGMQLDRGILRVRSPYKELDARVLWLPEFKNMVFGGHGVSLNANIGAPVKAEESDIINAGSELFMAKTFVTFFNETKGEEAELTRASAAETIWKDRVLEQSILVGLYINVKADGDVPRKIYDIKDWQDHLRPSIVACRTALAKPTKYYDTWIRLSIQDANLLPPEDIFTTVPGFDADGGTHRMSHVANAICKHVDEFGQCMDSGVISDPSTREDEEKRTIPYEQYIDAATRSGVRMTPLKRLVWRLLASFITVRHTTMAHMKVIDPLLESKTDIGTVAEIVATSELIDTSRMLVKERKFSKWIINSLVPPSDIKTPVRSEAMYRHMLKFETYGTIDPASIATHDSVVAVAWFSAMHYIHFKNSILGVIVSPDDAVRWRYLQTRRRLMIPATIGKRFVNIAEIMESPTVTKRDPMFASAAHAQTVYQFVWDRIFAGQFDVIDTKSIKSIPLIVKKVKTSSLAVKSIDEHEFEMSQIICTYFIVAFHMRAIDRVTKSSYGYTSTFTPPLHNSVRAYYSEELDRCTEIEQLHFSMSDTVNMNSSTFIEWANNGKVSGAFVVPYAIQMINEAIDCMLSLDRENLAPLQLFCKHLGAAEDNMTGYVYSVWRMINAETIRLSKDHTLTITNKETATSVSDELLHPMTNLYFSELQNDSVDKNAIPLHLLVVNQAHYEFIYNGDTSDYSIVDLDAIGEDTKDTDEKGPAFMFNFNDDDDDDGDNKSPAEKAKATKAKAREEAEVKATQGQGIFERIKAPIDSIEYKANLDPTIVNHLNNYKLRSKEFSARRKVFDRVQTSTTGSVSQFDYSLVSPESMAQWRAAYNDCYGGTKIKSLTKLPTRELFSERLKLIDDVYSFLNITIIFMTEMPSYMALFPKDDNTTVFEWFDAMNRKPVKCILSPNQMIDIAIVRYSALIDDSLQDGDIQIILSTRIVLNKRIALGVKLNSFEKRWYNSLKDTTDQAILLYDTQLGIKAMALIDRNMKTSREPKDARDAAALLVSDGETMDLTKMKWARANIAKLEEASTIWYTKPYSERNKVLRKWYSKFKGMPGSPEVKREAVALARDIDDNYIAAASSNFMDMHIKRTNKKAKGSKAVAYDAEVVTKDDDDDSDESDEDVVIIIQDDVKKGFDKWWSIEILAIIKIVFSMAGVPTPASFNKRTELETKNLEKFKKVGWKEGDHEYKLSADTMIVHQKKLRNAKKLAIKEMDNIPLEFATLMARVRAYGHRVQSRAVLPIELSTNLKRLMLVLSLDGIQLGAENDIEHTEVVDMKLTRDQIAYAIRTKSKVEDIKNQVDTLTNAVNTLRSSFRVLPAHRVGVSNVDDNDNNGSYSNVPVFDMITKDDPASRVLPSSEYELPDKNHRRSRPVFTSDYRNELKKAAYSLKKRHETRAIEIPRVKYENANPADDKGSRTVFLPAERATLYGGLYTNYKDPKEFVASCIEYVLRAKRQHLTWILSCLWDDTVKYYNEISQRDLSCFLFGIKTASSFDDAETLRSYCHQLNRAITVQRFAFMQPCIEWFYARTRMTDTGEFELNVPIPADVAIRDDPDRVNYDMLSTLRMIDPKCYNVSHANPTFINVVNALIPNDRMDVLFEEYTSPKPIEEQTAWDLIQPITHFKRAIIAINTCDEMLGPLTSSFISKYIPSAVYYAMQVKNGDEKARLDLYNRTFDALQIRQRIKIIKTLESIIVRKFIDWWPEITEQPAIDKIEAYRLVRSIANLSIAQQNDKHTKMPDPVDEYSNLRARFCDPHKYEMTPTWLVTGLVTRLENDFVVSEWDWHVDDIESGISELTIALDSCLYLSGYSSSMLIGESEPPIDDSKQGIHQAAAFKGFNSRTAVAFRNMYKESITREPSPPEHIAVTVGALDPTNSPSTRDTLSRLIIAGEKEIIKLMDTSSDDINKKKKKKKKKRGPIKIDPDEYKYVPTVVLLGDGDDDDGDSKSDKKVSPTPAKKKIAATVNLDSDDDDAGNDSDDDVSNFYMETIADEAIPASAIPKSDYDDLPKAGDEDETF